MRYPLLPYSQLVYDTVRWLPFSVCFEGEICFADAADQKERLREAVRRVLYNHPIFQMRTDWRGRQYAAPLRDIFNGPYHCFSIDKKDGDLFLNARIHAMLADGQSVSIMMQDLYRAFNGLPLKSDDYWQYMEQYCQHRNSQHYADSRLWLENEFADASVPVRPTTDRRLWTLLPPKAAIYSEDFSDLNAAIRRVEQDEYLPMDGFVSLCVALAIADDCGTDAAALTWAYAGRERIEERRIVGQLHRDIPFQIRRDDTNRRDKKALIQQARNQIRNGIAHSDYPYTLTAPQTRRWNYAVNVIRLNNPAMYDRLQILPIRYFRVSPIRYAVGILDVEFYPEEHLLQLVYRYSATHYKESSITKFAARVRHYAEWLTSDIVTNNPL